MPVFAQLSTCLAGQPNISKQRTSTRVPLTITALRSMSSTLTFRANSYASQRIFLGFVGLAPPIELDRRLNLSKVSMRRDRSHRQMFAFGNAWNS